MLCWQSWSAGSRRSDVTGGASDSGGAVGRPDPSSVRWELALCFRQQWAYSSNIPCQIQPLGEYWLLIWNKCVVCCVQLVGTCICGAGMKAGSSVCHLEAWRRKNAEQIMVKGLKYIWLYIWMDYSMFLFRKHWPDRKWRWNEPSRCVHLNSSVPCSSGRL